MVGFSTGSQLEVNVLYCLAALYAVVFVAIGLRWPAIPLLSIFALAPFQNDISQSGVLGDGEEAGEVVTGGPHFSIAEINLLLTCCVFVLRRRRILFGPITTSVLGYVCACVLSAAVNWRPSTFVCLVQIVMYLLVAVIVFTSLGRGMSDYKPALVGLLFVGFVLAVAVIVMRSGYVLGLHKNGVGGSLAAAVVVGTELWLAARRVKERVLFGALVGVCAAGLLFSLSRGGWIGAISGILLIFGLRRRWYACAKLLGLMAPLIALCWAFLPEQSKAYAKGFDRENWNIRLRYESFEFARHQFEQSPIIGVGVGLRKEYDATNVFLLTLAETGLIGMAAFLFLHIRYAHFVWITHLKIRDTDPLFSLVSLGGALLLSKFVHGMVDHYWSRGAIMIGWAAAGMLTHAHFVTVQRRRTDVLGSRRVESLAVA